MGHSNCDVCGNDKKMCICPKDLYVRQEGGDHYQADYQHWDLVIDLRMGYLEGNATKYVSRWQKKGGVQDLHKAMTYVDKLIANYDKVINLSLQFSQKVRGELCDRFIASAKLGGLEADFCLCMADWSTKNDLLTAKAVLDGLITKASAGQGRAAGGA